MNKKITVIITIFSIVCLALIWSLFMQYRAEVNKTVDLIAIADSNEEKTALKAAIHSSVKYMSLPVTVSGRDGGESDGAIVSFRKMREYAQEIYINPKSSASDIDAAADGLNSAVKLLDDIVLESETPKKDNGNLISALYINESKCAYDKQSGIFYFPVDITKTEASELYVTSSSGLSDYTAVEILDENGTLPPLFIPDVGKEYTLSAVSREYEHEYTLIFTGMPVVQVNEISRIGNSYRDCEFSLTDPAFEYSPGNTSYMYVETDAQIHVRGASARNWEKKSYALKLISGSGEAGDMGLLGMRTHSDWILDAMFIDMSRARNRVSTDLWNSYSCPLYYEDEVKRPVKNGTSGEYVELFINDEYMGMYCFTDKIDRAQLQVMKYDEENDIIHGMIYKGKAWEEPLRFKSYYPYNNNSNWWGSFQQKYPRPENGYPIDWQPMYNFVEFVVDANDDIFRKNIGKIIDIDNFVDYTIFMCYTYANDNTGKNAYWSVYDIQDFEMAKFFITVWDVKSTWGRTWNPAPTDPAGEWMDSDAEHDTALFRRLVLTNADGFADKMRARWEELKHNELAPEKVKALFNQYFELFEKSGAWDREAARWNRAMKNYCGMTLNLHEEWDYILEWIDARYEYIDDFIMNKLDTVGQFAK